MDYIMAQGQLQINMVRSVYLWSGFESAVRVWVKTYAEVSQYFRWRIALLEPVEELISARVGQLCSTLLWLDASGMHRQHRLDVQPGQAWRTVEMT